LRDGDLLLVDAAQPRLRGSGIYAFRVQGMLAIRRLQMKLDGSVMISSDNPTAGPAENFTADDASSLDIVGRAIWAGGRL
jgi:phage repressor protein C with HTH and peptisase S24 domain